MVVAPKASIACKVTRVSSESRGLDIFEVPFDKDEDIMGNYTGTGMHGGKIYIRGNIKTHKLGEEVKKVGLDSNDICILNKYIDNYNNYFNSDKIRIPVDGNDFVKLIPYSLRPYGNLYAY